MDQPNDSSIILKELSDIKASLAVNTSETANIKASMSEVKGDIKEIKNDFITRREFTEKVDDIQRTIREYSKYDSRIKWLERIAYGGIGVLTFLEFYFRYFK